jgi:prepilin-type processing-associated H-X9-DG protein
MNNIATGKSTTSMPAPAGTVLVSESSAKTKTAISIPSWQPYPAGTCPNIVGAPSATACPDGTDGPTTDTNHDGGNYGFADGHSKYSKKSGMTYSMFGWTGPCNMANGAPPQPNITGADATVTHLLDLDPKVNGSWQYQSWNALCNGSSF